MGREQHDRDVFDRRGFLRRSTGAVAAVGVGAAVAGAAPAAAVGDFLPPGLFGPSRTERFTPAPRPIPGGITLPDGTVIHVLAPGPTDVTLPFSGGQLMGLDVATSTITDFEGTVALAFTVGSALAADGTVFDVETDMRAFQGRYVGEDGEIHEGTFGFV